MWTEIFFFWTLCSLGAVTLFPELHLGLALIVVPLQIVVLCVILCGCVLLCLLATDDDAEVFDSGSVYRRGISRSIRD